jgi:hypothetical protein
VVRSNTALFLNAIGHIQQSQRAFHPRHPVTAAGGQGGQGGQGGLRRLLVGNDLHGFRRVRVLGLRALHGRVEGFEETGGVGLEEPDMEIVVVE